MDINYVDNNRFYNGDKLFNKNNIEKLWSDSNMIKSIVSRKCGIFDLYIIY